MNAARALVIAGICASWACRGEAKPGPGAAPAQPVSVPPFVVSSSVARAPFEQPPPPPPRVKNDKTPLGTNLMLMKSYSGEWPFKDVFHQASFWRSQGRYGAADNRPVAYDPQGWVTHLEPGQQAVARLFGVPGMRYPTGIYSVTWTGVGHLEFVGAKVVGVQPQGALLRVEGTTDGIDVVLTATDPRAPLKNIQILMPGGSCANDDHKSCDLDAQCPASRCVPFAVSVARQPFHPTFLASNEPYSTLRFMHWGDTVGSRVQTWEQRSKLDAATWTPFGVPYEIMIQLSNHLKTDIWITLPPLADDDFAKQLGALVKASLDPSLKVYLEYGNEIWNYAYPDGAELRARGLKLGLSTDPHQAMIRYYSMRATELFDRFGASLGDQRRLVRVLSGQSENPANAQLALEYEKAHEKIDAFAIAPYFGGGLGGEKAFAKVSSSTVDQLLDALEQDFVAEAIAGVKKHKELLDKYNKGRKVPIELIAYEGGQHLVGVGMVQRDERVTKLFLETNRHARMKKIYLDYLDAWKASGGHLFMHFVHTRFANEWGAFGAIERPGQTRAEAPKLDALLTFIEKNPRWW